MLCAILTTLSSCVRVSLQVHSPYGEEHGPVQQHEQAGAPASQAGAMGPPPPRLPGVMGPPPPRTQQGPSAGRI